MCRFALFQGCLSLPAVKTAFQETGHKLSSRDCKAMAISALTGSVFCDGSLLLPMSFVDFFCASFSRSSVFYYQTDRTLSTMLSASDDQLGNSVDHVSRIKLRLVLRLVLTFGRFTIPVFSQATKPVYLSVAR